VNPGRSVCTVSRHGPNKWFYYLPGSVCISSVTKHAGGMPKRTNKPNTLRGRLTGPKCVISADRQSCSVPPASTGTSNIIHWNLVSASCRPLNWNGPQLGSTDSQCIPSYTLNIFRYDSSFNITKMPPRFRWIPLRMIEFPSPSTGCVMK
jgi:hypothetical protein